MTGRTTRELLLFDVEDEVTKSFLQIGALFVKLMEKFLAESKKSSRARSWRFKIPDFEYVPRKMFGASKTIPKGAIDPSDMRTEV